MQQFLVRRVSWALLALFALSILTFLLVRIERYEVRRTWYPYDRDEKPSLVVQYSHYGQDLFRGKWDKSWGFGHGSDDIDRMVVLEDLSYSQLGEGDGSRNVVLERLSATLVLASLALAVSAALGTALGVLAAIRRGSLFDRWANIAVAFGTATPVFWFGVLLVGISVFLPGWMTAYSGGGFSHLILPAITLALLPTAMIAKLVRAALLAALDSDYVKLARIRGVAEWKIILKHCLRNVAVSPLLSFGLIGGTFMTALVLTEAVFEWPGVGLLALQTIASAIDGYDYHPMLSGIVLVLAGGFIMCHLIYDAVRAFLDPRIRYSEGAVPGTGAGY